jgi:chromosome segregation ATPase
MSIAKTIRTAKLLNDLLDSQKVDRARVKQLEGRCADSDTRQAAAVAAASATAEMQFKAQLDRVQREHAAEHAALTAIVTNKDLEVNNCNWQITALKQELSGARQLLAAADASNEELRGITETLGNNLDKAMQAATDLADERAEIAKQREALNHLLDEVRARMRKRELVNENAILNRKVLASAAPGLNLK